MDDRVVIGMDPHKRSVTIEVMAADETILGGDRFNTDVAGFRAMREYVRRWPQRVWAIEGCQGIGKRKKAANKELEELVAATGTSLLDLQGIGPSGAAQLLVDVGDITRFATRAHFASWNGTAPIDASSGDVVRHRLSRAGNRQINRVLHIMATVQLRNPTEGRGYYDRKVASGKGSMEAMRCLKRRLSDIVYRHMVNDAIAHAMTGPGGHRGTTTDSSVTDSHPIAGSSDKPLPGPATSQPRTPAAAAG